MLAELEKYQIALDLKQIEKVHVPMALASIENPELKTSPQLIAKIHDEWFEHQIGVCREAFSDIRLAECKIFFEHIAAQRFGVRFKLPENVHSRDDVYEAWLSTLWLEISHRLENQGLAKFVVDSGAAISTAVWAAILTLPSGEALEGAFGYGLDIAGNRIKIPPTDPMWIWSPRNIPGGGDLGFQFSIFRCEEAIKAMKDPQVKTIFVLGAGWLTEIRHFPNDYLRGKKIQVCDPDPKLPSNLLSDLPEWLQNSIEYHHIGIQDFIPMMLQKGIKADLVYMMGVASFMFDKMPGLIGAAMSLLKPGGRFMFDVELDHLILKRDIFVMSWGGIHSDIKLELMQEEVAIDRVETLCMALSNKFGVKLMVTHEVQPTTDTPPMGVIFTMQTG